MTPDLADQLKALLATPRTVAELVAALKMTTKQVESCVSYLRRCKKIYVVRRIRCRSQPAAVYALGNLPDAPKLPPMEPKKPGREPEIVSIGPCAVHQSFWGMA